MTIHLTFRRALLLFFLSIATCCLVPAQGLSVGEAAAQKGQYLYDCSQFYEASEQLQLAANKFSATGKTEQQLSALCLLESAYDMTFENEKRERVLDQLHQLTALKLGEFHPLHHKAMIRKADYWFDIGQSDQTRSYLLPLMPRFREHNDYWSLSSGHLLLGGCHQKKLDRERAGEEYKTALELCQVHLPEDTSLQVFVLDILGYFYTRMGYNSQAVGYCQQRMDLFTTKEHLTAHDSLEIAKCHLAFSWAYGAGGDPDLVMEHAEKALSLFRVISLSHRRFIGEALLVTTARGSRFYKDPDEQALLRTTRLQADAFLKDPTDKFMALNLYFNNIFLLQKGNDPEENRVRRLETYQLVKRWGITPQGISISSCLLELGKGNGEKALEFAQNSMDQFYQEYGMQDCALNRRGMSSFMIGLAFLQIAEYDSAARSFHHACQDFTLTFQDDDMYKNPGFRHGCSDIHLLDAWYYKGVAFQAMAKRDQDPQKLEAAFWTHIECIEFIDSLRNDYTNQRGKLNLSANVHRLCEGVMRSGLSLYEIHQDTQYLYRAFWASEMAKSQLLLETWTRARSLRAMEIPDKDLAIEDSLKKELIFFQGALLRETKGEKVQDSLWVDHLKVNINQVKEELRKWEANIEERFPGQLANWNQRIIPSPTQIQESLLQPDENLVTYFVGEEEIYYFLISQEEVKGMRRPKPEGFEETVQRYLHSIGNYQFVMDSVPEGFSQYTSSAFQLYEWLLQPLFPEGVLPAKLKVIPDQSLAQLPFEALLTTPVSENVIDYPGLPYLIRSTQVHYGFSVAFLWGNRTLQRASPNIRCLAVAPGGMGGNTRSKAGRLPKLRGGEKELQGTQEEVGMIANLGVSGQFLLGDSATKERFKDLAPEYQLIHLATHGMADHNIPERSNLSFAPIEGDTIGDYRLYAYELEGITLNAELAVLSACESGVGRHKIGEGPMSLGRGFLANGVSAVVMTLWKVEDQTSSQLMQTFYQYMVEGVPVDHALYQAKIDALSQADSRTAHPYFWAGYISNGISKSLDFEKEKGGNTKWVLLLGILVATAVFFGFRKKAKMNQKQPL